MTVKYILFLKIKVKTLEGYLPVSFTMSLPLLPRTRTSCVPFSESLSSRTYEMSSRICEMSCSRAQLQWMCIPNLEMNKKTMLWWDFFSAKHVSVLVLLPVHKPYRKKTYSFIDYIRVILFFNFDKITKSEYKTHIWLT